MVPKPKKQPQNKTVTKKVKKPSGGGGKKKLSAFNRYMKAEMARLKVSHPHISHQDRFKMATMNWKTAKENPKNDS